MFEGITVVVGLLLCFGRGVVCLLRCGLVLRLFFGWLGVGLI